MSSQDLEAISQGIKDTSISTSSPELDSNGRDASTNTIASIGTTPQPKDDLDQQVTPAQEEQGNISVMDEFNEFVTKMRSGVFKDFVEIKRSIERILVLAEEYQESDSADHSSTVEALANLDGLLQQFISRTGDVECLSFGIRCGTRALTLIPKNDADRAGWLNNLGNSYWMRFRHQGTPNDLDMALDYYTQAKELLPQDSDALNRIVHNLGNCFLNRYQFHGTSVDLDQAIEYYQQAMSLTPQGSQEIAEWMNSLTIALYERYQLRNELKDLDQAIKYQETVIGLANERDPSLPGWLGNLGNFHQAKFELVASLEEIDQSINCIQRAISITPDGHPNMASLLNNLGDSLRMRYEQTSVAEDINNAVDAHSRAVSMTPHGHPMLPGRLSTLGESYLLRNQHLGEDEDLQKALKFHRQAVQLTPSTHPNRAKYLMAMGNSYLMEFSNYGRISDIDETVSHFHQALVLAPSESAMIPNLLNSLGGAYFQRFTRLNNPPDLDKSIELIERSLSLTPDAHIGLPGFLMNLGNSYARRFEKQEKLEDIDMAINYQTRAKNLIPDRHVDRPGLLYNLGNSYRLRYDHSIRNEDITNAIDYISAATTLALDGDKRKPSILNSLAIAYSSRYARQGDSQDMKKAIELHSQATFLTPNEHATLPVILKNLGSLYHDLYRIQKDQGLLEKALDYYQKSAQHPVGDTRCKFESAYAWAWLSAAASWPLRQQMEAYTTAMSLVPHLLLPNTGIEEQYREVRRVGDLALGAAATAINAGEYDTAFQWLEQGRTIIWNHFLRLQSPLEELSLVNPALADRLCELSNELRQASFWKPFAPTTPNDSYNLEMEAQRHRRIAEDYAQLIEQVRTLPGLDNFLGSPKLSELTHAARSGPVIMVNVAPMRSDALVLMPNHEKFHIPLPNLTSRQVEHSFKNLTISLQHQHIRARGIRKVQAPQPERTDNFSKILTSLWRNLAKPIVDGLGYVSKPGADDLPHITWCTTGALSFLPLHAAGDYEQTDARLFNYAVSSYTPTLSALLAPAPETDSASVRPTLLAVGLENALGHDPLPGTRKELESVEGHVRSSAHYKQLQGHNATPDKVLAEMERFDWVHLACHARQDGTNPTSSGFFLHGGTLSLNLIMQRRFKNKGLAFLSACQTATGDEEIPNEVAHLAAGMLMAGYTSVIGTMWSIMDADAPLIADRVYERLLGGQGVNSRHRDAARALHYAVEQLRREVGENSFSRWAQFIHIGM